MHPSTVPAPHFRRTPPPVAADTHTGPADDPLVEPLVPSGEHLAAVESAWQEGWDARGMHPDWNAMRWAAILGLTAGALLARAAHQLAC